MKFAEALVMVVVVAVVAAAAASGLETATFIGFRRYSGYYLQGNVAVTLKGVSLVQCAAICEPHRVFNAYGSWPTYTCHILSSFTSFIENQLYSVYYDPDMYQRMGFYVALGRSVFTPPSNSPRVSWMTAYWTCRDIWAGFLVPKTQAEWEWMKQVAADSSYEGMWIGLQEQAEGSNSYMWIGLTTSLAPGAVDLTWADDGVTNFVENTSGMWVADDTHDCGVLLQWSGGQVAIENCYDALYANYICEAIFPPL